MFNITSPNLLLGVNVKNDFFNISFIYSDNPTNESIFKNNF
jgi:hypothetical protein